MQRRAHLVGLRAVARLVVTGLVASVLATAAGVAGSVTPAAADTDETYYADISGDFGGHYQGDQTIISRHEDWMGDLPGGLLMGRLTIPGSHDSAAYWANTSNESAQTQAFDIEDQLILGIRFFDFRVICKGAGDLQLWHGLINLDMKLSQALDRINSFLLAHPDEAVIVSVGDESDNFDVPDDNDTCGYAEGQDFRSTVNTELASGDYTTAGGADMFVSSASYYNTETDYDSDDDGVLDYYDASDFSGDGDGDGLNDADEMYLFKTDPTKRRTTGAGLDDGDLTTGHLSTLLNVSLPGIFGPSSMQLKDIDTNGDGTAGPIGGSELQGFYLDALRGHGWVFNGRSDGFPHDGSNVSRFAQNSDSTTGVSGFWEVCADKVDGCNLSLADKRALDREFADYANDGDWEDIYLGENVGSGYMDPDNAADGLGDDYEGLNDDYVDMLIETQDNNRARHYGVAAFDFPGPGLLDRLIHQNNWYKPGTWIGVLKDADACGDQKDEYEISFDNEDSDNASEATGWLGASSQETPPGPSRTNLVLCKVRADGFQPPPHGIYSVLKMSDGGCPPGRTGSGGTSRTRRTTTSTPARGTSCRADRRCPATSSASSSARSTPATAPARSPGRGWASATASSAARGRRQPHRQRLDQDGRRGRHQPRSRHPRARHGRVGRPRLRQVQHLLPHAEGRAVGVDMTMTSPSAECHPSIRPCISVQGRIRLVHRTPPTSATFHVQEQRDPQNPAPGVLRYSIDGGPASTVALDASGNAAIAGLQALSVTPFEQPHVLVVDYDDGTGVHDRVSQVIEIEVEPGPEPSVAVFSPRPGDVSDGSTANCADPTGASAQLVFGVCGAVTWDVPILPIVDIQAPDGTWYEKVGSGIVSWVEHRPGFTGSFSVNQVEKVFDGTATTYRLSVGGFALTQKGNGQYTAYVITAANPEAAATQIAIPFTVDGDDPTVGIDYPAEGATLMSDQLLGQCGGLGYGLCGDVDGTGSTPTVQFDLAGVSGGVHGPAEVSGGRWFQPIAPGTLLEGAYTLTVQATDAAGRTSGEVTRTFTVDDTPPETVISSPAAEAVFSSWSTTCPSGTQTVAGRFCGTIAGGVTSVKMYLRKDGKYLDFTTKQFTGTKAEAATTKVFDPAAFDTDPDWQFDVPSGTSITEGRYMLTVAVSDAIGNHLTTIRRVTYDTNAPVVEVVPIGGTKSSTGWFTVAPVSYVVKTTDLTTTTCTTPTRTDAASGDSAAVTIEATCTDEVGHATTGKLIYKLDTHAPTVTVTPKTEPNAAGWFQTAPSSTSDYDVNGTDNLTAAGQLVCSMTSVAPVAGNPNALLATGKCTDKAGLSATGEYTAHVDGAAPTVTVTLSPPTGNGSAGWYKTAPDIVVAGEDPVSGIATCDANGAYTGPDGAALSVERHCTDVAGNQGTGSSPAFKLDRAAPTIDIRLPSGDLPYGSAAVADFDCADATPGSGVATCVGTVADGAAIDTLTLGPKTFTVVATDNAGNTTSRPVSYQVVKATPSVSVATSPSPSVFGGPVTITATVSGAPAPAVRPGGTVTFTDGATALGMATIGADGKASLTTAALHGGSHPLQASYGGDGRYLAETGSTTHVVQPAATRLVVSRLLSTGLRPTATLTRADNGAPIAGQVILFLTNSGALCTATTNAQGRAQCSSPLTITLFKRLNGAYAGSSDYLGSTGSAGL